MYLFEIYDILQDKIPEKNFHVVSSDKLPFNNSDYPMFICVNSSPSFVSQGHWCGIHIDKDRNGYFFNSLSQFVEPNVESISKFLSQKCKTIQTTKFQIQPTMSQTCGLYVVCFLLCSSRGMSFNDFLKQFSPNLILNDFLIKRMFDYLVKA